MKEEPDDFGPLGKIVGLGCLLWAGVMISTAALLLVYIAKAILREMS